MESAPVAMRIRAASCMQLKYLQIAGTVWFKMSPVLLIDIVLRFPDGSHNKFPSRCGRRRTFTIKLFIFLMSTQ